MVKKSFQNIELSRLGMGNMRLPANKDKSRPGEIDWAEAEKIIDLAMANGINYYDTAHVYNRTESESCVGHCLKKYDRNSFNIATKWHIDACADYRTMFESQLERLQTDHIDFYLIHCLLDGNIDKYLASGGIEYLLEQKAKGRIRYLGFSSHAGLDTLERFASHHQWDFAQIQLNYYDWLYSSTAKEYEILEKHNIPIMVMEPVRGGRLSKLTPECEAILKAAHPDWSISSWALRFVKGLPQVQTILSGMSTLEQMEDNLKTFETAEGLNEADKKLLFEVCEKFSNQVKIPCTGCRYCCEPCPMQINIPEWLKLLNTYKIDGAWALNGASAIESQGKPKDCLSCGACMQHCPQGINTPDYMAELAGLLE